MLEKQTMFHIYWRQICSLGLSYVIILMLHHPCPICTKIQKRNRCFSFFYLSSYVSLSWTRVWKTIINVTNNHQTKDQFSRNLHIQITFLELFGTMEDITVLWSVASVYYISNILHDQQLLIIFETREHQRYVVRLKGVLLYVSITDI